MNTLIVSYLPRGGRSHTRRLLDAFRSEARVGAVEELDLLEDVPDLLLRDQVDAYIRRNYLREEIGPAQRALLATMDRMTAQFKRADIVAVAFPMYNFSMPAVVKAYFDSILQKGETWTIDAGGYRGLMQGKRALILMASGGEYDGDRSPMEHAVSLARTQFEFMGFEDIETVTAAGVNRFPDRAETIVHAARDEVRRIARAWLRGDRPAMSPTRSSEPVGRP